MPINLSPALSDPWHAERLSARRRRSAWRGRQARAQRLGPAALAFALLAALAGCGGDSPSPATWRLAAARTSGDASRGLALVTQYQCGACHAIPGVPASRGIHGPSLEAFGKRSYIAGQVPNTPQALARWIVQPSALVPGTTMPSMGVSPEEARDMAAYIGSLE